MDKIQHLRPPWQNIAKAMQDYARNRNNGIALIKVGVLVNQDGNPLFWNNPLCLKVEPRRLQREDLEKFTKEELLTLLVAFMAE